MLRECLLSDWINVPENYDDYQGFVYKITHKASGKYYIGKKFFWKALRRKPLKGKKRVRLDAVVSDWKEYWGSSRKLLEDVALFGKDDFVREILGCYENKFLCAYHELREQMEHNALFDPLSYNEIINVRLRFIKQ